jgi:hypothetical protein
MAGKVLKFTNGFPGTVTRSIDDIVETLASGEASNPILFGAPVALDDGKVVNVAASKTNIIGIAMRSIKTENTYGGNDPKYNAGELVDVIKRGTVAVLVSNGTPAAGGTVHIVKATGAIRTTQDSTNTVEMTGWKFKGGVDDNNVAEIVLTERAY